MNYGDTLNRRTALKGLAALGAATAFPSALIAAPRPFERSRAVLSDLVAFGLPCAMGGVDTGGGPQIIAAGHLDFDSSRAPDAHSLWRLYSMTKPIAGIAAMVLVGEGKIGLDQPVGDIIPAYARPMVLVDPNGSLADVRPAKRPITVRQLMTHTSGHASMNTSGDALKEALQAAGLNSFPISPYAPTPAANRPAGLADFVDRLAKLPLMVEPGTQYNYGYGLDVLGRVIEVVEGKPFETVLREKLFDPLGMHETFFQAPRARAADMVSMVEFKDGKASPLDPGPSSAWLNPPSHPSGSGGLVSSAHDYHRFLAMLAGEGALGGVRVMSAETARLAMSDLLDPAIDRSRIAIPGYFGHGAGGALGGPGLNRDCFGWWGAGGTVAWVDKRTKLCGTMWQQFFPPTTILRQEAFCKAVYADLGWPNA